MKKKREKTGLFKCKTIAVLSYTHDHTWSLLVDHWLGDRKSKEREDPKSQSLLPALLAAKETISFFSPDPNFQISQFFYFFFLETVSRFVIFTSRRWTRRDEEHASLPSGELSEKKEKEKKLLPSIFDLSNNLPAMFYAWVEEENISSFFQCSQLQSLLFFFRLYRNWWMCSFTFRNLS